MGMLQIMVVGLTQEPSRWNLLLAIIGISFAISGGLFLRDLMNSDEQ